MAAKVWKDGTRRGIAYVEGREDAERIMKIAGRAAIKQNAANAEAALAGAMAVYSDAKGKPFAWQIPFDLGEWDKVAAMFGDNGIVTQ